MAFEKFEESGQGRGRGTAKPKISLRKSASIGVNTAALEEFFPEDAEAAVMYYDEDEDRVGIKPVDEKDSEEGAYTLTRTESGGSITPGAFMRRNGLVPERTMQFTPRMVTVNQNLELVAFTASEDGEDFIQYYGQPDEDE